MLLNSQKMRKTYHSDLLVPAPPDSNFERKEKRVVQNPNLDYLKEQQREVFDALVEFLENKEEQYFLVEGYAGTGKTTLISTFIEWVLFNSEHKVAMTAPTNKAVKVLNRAGEYKSPNLEYRTVHSLLGLREKITSKGRQIFVQNKVEDASIGNYDILVIDEISMLSDNLIAGTIDKYYSITGLLDYAKMMNIKIIFVGDPCFAKGTGVLMYDGTIKNVEEIEVGDVVMGDDSTKRVVKTLFRGKSPMYEIKQSGGSTYVVTPNHKVVLKRATTQNRYQLGDEIAITAQELATKSDKFFECYKGYKKEVNYFSAKSLELHPYFLGLWLGDGERSGTRISTNDIEIMEWLEAYGNQLGLAISKRQEHEDSDCYRISLSNGSSKKGSNPIRTGLQILNLLGCECKFIPTHYLLASREDRLNLLAGLIDTDGSLDETGGRFRFSNCDILLVEDTAKLARELGFKVSVSQVTPEIGQVQYLVNISGNVWEIPTRIARKQLEERVVRKNLSLSTLKVTLLNKMDYYYGFEVDGNNKFLLADCTVAHNCQIPPVGAIDCMIFNEESRDIIGIRRMVLTQIIRQAADNPIIKVTLKLRNALGRPEVLPIREDDFMENTDGVYFLTTEDRPFFYQMLKNYFNSERFKQDADFMKVLAWTNKTVKSFNLTIRKMIYGAGADKICVGEKLIANRPITNDEGFIIFHNNDEFEVLSYEVVEGNYKGAELWYYNTEVKGYEGVKKIKIVHEKSQDDYELILGHLVELAKAERSGSWQAAQKWEDFYRIQEVFADVNYNYAITCHKSQGSTYENALIIENDIDKNRKIKERNRIKYTAFTRPSRRLFIAR